MILRLRGGGSVYGNSESRGGYAAGRRYRWRPGRAARRRRWHRHCARARSGAGIRRRRSIGTHAYCCGNFAGDDNSNGAEFLAAVFATVALAVAIKMALPLDDKNLSNDIPRGVLGPAIPIGIGTVSTLMGIGGGTLSVTAMTLSNKPIHLAVGTASLFGLVIALPSTLGYVISGWDNALLPAASLGYVNLLGFAVISPATVLFAPLGAKIAHALPRRRLSILFGIFLFIVAVRMGLRAVA